MKKIKKTNKSVDVERIAEELEIDKDNLDENIARLPATYFYYGEKWTKAVMVKDAAKVHVDEVYSEREKIIRVKLAKKEDKVTEAMVRAEVQNDLQYREAYDEYLDAKQKCDLLAIVKEAFEQKASMMKAMVSYMTTQYNNTGSISGEVPKTNKVSNKIFSEASKRAVSKEFMKRRKGEK